MSTGTPLQHLSTGLGFISLGVAIIWSQLRHAKGKNTLQRLISLARTLPNDNRIAAFGFALVIIGCVALIPNTDLTSRR